MRPELGPGVMAGVGVAALVILAIAVPWAWFERSNGVVGHWVPRRRWRSPRRRGEGAVEGAKAAAETVRAAAAVKAKIVWSMLQMLSLLSICFVQWPRATRRWSRRRARW